MGKSELSADARGATIPGLHFATARGADRVLSGGDIDDG
jgi:hypothetical protein